ncbi:t-complex protein 11 domain-containing protein [Ditylenchus destructor]|nr:t-complex protein 11 domain-containing protein [Ditylenchus destructor]
MFNKNNSDEEKGRRSPSPSSADQRDASPSSSHVGSSPEKKRTRPNPPGTPTKSIPIKNPNEDTSIKHSNEGVIQDGKLPLWVAGSSPAKFINLEDIIKVNSSLEKMAIIHEIAVDPKFNVENFQKNDPIYQSVKSVMHKAFWEALRTDFEKDPPDYSHAFSLLGELKELIKEQLTAGNLANALTALEEALNMDHLKALLDRKMLDFHDVLQTILMILEKLCAPARDELVAKLKTENDVALLFKGVFELVEFMKIDMANFAVSQNRGTIESYSAEIEREEFMKVIQLDRDGPARTKAWLKRSTSGSDSVKLSKEDITQLIISLYLSLLEVTPAELSNTPFPETLKLDEHRFLALGEKYLQLILTTAAVFISSNLAGKDVCESTDFKITLKNELIVILNDVSWSNYTDKLGNVFQQCNKDLAKYSGESWTENKNTLLKQQILALANVSDRIRQIAKNRICDFLRQVLQQTGKLQLPPGLSIIQSELAAVTSRFYTIVTHNWKTFGTFYAEILQDQFADKRK